MDKKQKPKIEKKEEAKHLHCPFDRTLACEDCRLYRPFVGGGGQKECVLILAGLNA